MGIKELQRIVVLALWEAEMEGTRTDSGEIVVREHDGKQIRNYNHIGDII